MDITICNYSKANLSLQLKKDELIHTEHSHKYKLAQILELMYETGFDVKNTRLDENEYFAMMLVSKKHLNF